MIGIRRIVYSDNDFHAQIGRLVSADVQFDPDLIATTSEIINEVRTGGDTALIRFIRKYENKRAEIEDIPVPRERLESAARGLPLELVKALKHAADRIRDYAGRQKLHDWSYHDKDGNLLGQQVTAVDRAGIYVPGGKASYPSSVLMNAIPARVAGVGEIVMAVPAPDGNLDPAVLAAAAIAGVDRVFTMGGAHAIAALAFGTETIPRADKIVGPGNRYVAAAKRLVYGTVGIDMIAGPSEVLILADSGCDPDWIAMDMFAQAEHDEDARAVLISTDPSFLHSVEESMNRLIPEMDRRDIILSSLERHGAFVHVKDLDEAVGIINRLAPEHLQIFVRQPETLLPQIRHAGAIFLGTCSAESLGDYCAGPNHVLPTAGTARFSSSLGVYDFQKRTTILKCEPDSAARLAVSASVLARREGLTAHARSAEYRTGRKK